MNTKRCWIIALLLASLPGCCNRIACPYWFHPGTETYQQARAERFDPYAEAQIGADPLSVDGSRPRDYARPASEVKRLQTNADAARLGVDAAKPAE